MHDKSGSYKYYAYKGRLLEITAINGNDFQQALT